MTRTQWAIFITDVLWFLFWAGLTIAANLWVHRKLEILL